MSNEPKAIRLSFKGIFRYFMDSLRSGAFATDKQVSAAIPVSREQEAKTREQADRENEKDPYEEIYQYMYMYWFI